MSKQNENVNSTTLFEEICSKINTECNSNFHFEKLGWAERVWIKNMCDSIEYRLDLIHGRFLYDRMVSGAENFSQNDFIKIKLYQDKTGCKRLVR